MILYFSGTGNSRYLAEVLSKETINQIISLNQLLRQQKSIKLQNIGFYQRNKLKLIW